MVLKKQKSDKSSRGLFKVNTLGVIFDPRTRKILIGKKEKDPNLSKRSWCFPSGRPKSNADLERNIERSVKSKTGLKVKSLGSVFSKIFDQNKDVLLIYYLCEAVGGKEKPGNGFKDLKWVYSHELIKRFANRFDKRLQEYILGLK